MDGHEGAQRYILSHCKKNGGFQVIHRGIIIEEEEK
jgi:hypothetical protein